MALILHIDTANENSIVCISRDEQLLAIQENHDQKNHAAFVQPAIKQMFESINQPLNAIDAVAVTMGPGSYTGLRVGLASAKGICFALDKPLLLINALELMALAVIRALRNKASIESNLLFCPMIDARRMEVFTALYDVELNPYLQPSAMVINEESFSNELLEHSILFCGNGMNKLENLISHKNAVFSSIQPAAEDFVELSARAFNKKQFADLAYSEPLYVKEFFSQAPKKGN